MNNEPVAIHDVLADVLGAKGIVGVPPEIAVDAVRKTAIDFCTQSTIWEFETGFNTQYNVSDYPIDVLIPEGSRIASMKWLAMNGYLLRPNTSGLRPIPNIIPNIDPNSWYSWWGNGYTFTMDGREIVWITPVPTQSSCCQLITFCAALKPTQDTCQLPWFLVEDWNDALSSGAAFRLFSQPKQDWSNGGLALQNRREYQNWIARARLTKMQNYTQAPGVMSGSYF